MTTKHTPGPWNVGSADGFNACTIFQEGPKHEQASICSVYGIPMNTRVEDVGSKWAQGMANARLIAAAPELLEALARIDQWPDEPIEDFRPDGAVYGEISVGEMKAIRAAIAKATGESR